jgi:hypothetical protein
MLKRAALFLAVAATFALAVLAGAVGWPARAEVVPAPSPAPFPGMTRPASERDADGAALTGTYGDRSRELLDYRCKNDLGVRQVTLFANGTVRVREGLGKQPRMRLGELGTVELEGYLRRLSAEDLSEVHDRQESAEGEWVERCSLHLALDGRPERIVGFSRFDSLPLAVATIVRVADELATHTLATTDLPTGYRPRAGDVLRRADGVLFEVRGFTSDGQGVEMQGVEQPLTLYVRPEDLPAMFESVVSRARP